MKKRILFSLTYLFVIVVASICFEAKSADTTSVQTFTFDSVFTRQAVFNFPDSNEKFQKVIAKYRLKCDSKTQHDKYSCGEWDYLTYLRIIKPTGDFNFSVRKHPVYTFGNFKKIEKNTVLKLTNSPIIDIINNIETRSTATSASSEEIELLKDGKEALGDFSRYQFLFTYKELAAAGMSAGSKIGKVILSANLVDTIRNFSFRIASISKLTQNLSDYYDASAFQTVARHSYIAPNECVNNKLTVDFSEDFEYNGNTNLIFEIIYDNPKLETNLVPSLVFFGTTTNNNRGVSAVVSNYIKLNGDDTWIDVATLPNTSGKQHFTWEAWVKLDDIGNIFSLGDKVVFSAVDANIDKTAAKLRLTLNNSKTSISTTNSTSLNLNTWAHVAVVFDGTGEQCKDVVKIYINGKETSMNYTNWYDNGWDVYMPRFVDDQLVSFSIGRGAYYSESSIKNNTSGLFAQVRVWEESLSASTIGEWYKETNITNKHPNISKLHTYLKFDDEYGATSLFNSGYSNLSAKIIGGVEILCDVNSPVFAKSNSFMPNISLAVGEFTYTSNIKIIETARKQLPTSIVYFTSENNYPEVSKINYKYSNYSYKYDIENNKLDSTKTTEEPTDFIVDDELFEYETKHYEKKQIFEIGRFITPYGINLSLGPDGFEWEYDLTDYMNELRGNVKIEAHNNQELIDLKFLFIKGESNRDILRISEPWGPAASYLYKDISRDVKLSDVEINLLPDTKSVKLKARLTGHGMVPDVSHASQCCEFLANTHKIYAGATEADYELAGEWSIWEPCMNNPVYPQGGTWMLPREGWCPGSTVKDYEFDLTSYVQNGRITLNYEIDDTKLNMYPEIGDGSYIANFHVIEYAAAKYKNDLELLEIITPSSADIYRRINPICNGIKVVVRNNSDEAINNYTIVANNKHNSTEIFEVNKSIKARSVDTAVIILQNANFWNIPSDAPSVDISVMPEGTDENIDNNQASATFALPDFYTKGEFMIKYKTNLRASDYSLKIYDFSNNLVKTFSANDNNRIYNFDIKDLPTGCYRMELVDNRYYYGLSFPMVSAQGAGSIEITNSTGKTLKSFNPDFGKQLVYSFAIDAFTKIKEKDIINSLRIYPNPTSEFIILEASEDFDVATICVYDQAGSTILTYKNILKHGELKLDVSFLPTGAYSISVSSGDSRQWSKFIRK